jgi:hypothetical protein
MREGESTAHRSAAGTPSQRSGSRKPRSSPPADARNCRHDNPPRAGAGDAPASISTLRTVVTETATPRPFNSPRSAGRPTADSPSRDAGSTRPPTRPSPRPTPGPPNLARDSANEFTNPTRPRARPRRAGSLDAYYQDPPSSLRPPFVPRATNPGTGSPASSRNSAETMLERRSALANTRSR